VQLTACSSLGYSEWGLIFKIVMRVDLKLKLKIKIKFIKFIKKTGLGTV
jgi:hypothetical protein